MASNVKAFSKTTFKSQITRKQSQFKRFKRRFNVAKNPVEKRFLKNEAKQICTELKQFAKQWKTFGFGGMTWVTKSCTISNFSSPTGKGGRKTSTRRYAKRTNTRKGHARRTAGSRTNRSTSNFRKGGARKTRSYSVAW